MAYSLQADGIRVPAGGVVHRDEEYDQAGFDVLRDMQSRHFWYRGRHRFLLRALTDELGNRPADSLAAVDLGGGCGGWVSYLKSYEGPRFGELALADSSARALQLAGSVLPPAIDRYLIDLYRLGWEDRWDVAFLLDVIEHLPQDSLAMREVARSLRPGGLLFVTTPALKFFWSYNDELAHHVRRYSSGDFQRLATESGFEHVRSRYFMFFLSPLLWISRMFHPRLKDLTQDQLRDLLQRTHRVPSAPVNGLLTCCFSAETPLGLRMPFPWGTSILGVFRKKA